MQLLGAYYNFIVASFIVCENDISFHLAHNILLTHEQRLCIQNSITKWDNIYANMVATQRRNFNNIKNHNNKGNNLFNNRNNFGKNQSSVCG